VSEPDKLAQYPAIEDECGVPLGRIFRLAGLVVDERMDTEQALRSDPRLDDEGRTMLLNMYAVLTHQAAAATGDRGTAAASAG
jgi:hypothetical protein